MKKSVRLIILLFILLVGGTVSVLMERYAFQTNNGFGFPLDDPWIHLQFAKNLHDYGSFSYYKNEMVTSGSTSPLYTFLLSIGFFITSNEMILSYTLGIGFLLLTAFFAYKLSEKYFHDNIYLPFVAVFLILFEPRLQWGALSGMETTIFIALLLATTYFYQKKSTIPFGISFGLLLWGRPEAVLLLLVVLADYLYNRYLVKSITTTQKNFQSEPLKWIYKSLGIVSIFGILYVGFNLFLSGSFFPNTYSAKIEYYSRGGQNYPEQVFHFLTDGHLVIFTFFVLIGFASIIYKIFKRQSESFLIPLLWCAGLFLAYRQKLPYLYQEGRYLMPLLPFYILIGLQGVNISLVTIRKINLFKKKRNELILLALLSATFVYQFVDATWEFRKNYSGSCKYITDRQVKTAKWLHDNLPQKAVIATHDIGAISFYSGRKIVDMVGLVSPEMIKNIGNIDKLKEFIVSKKVTHLAVLRNWFEVSNQNPIFLTDAKHPEIMEVFQFDPIRTHIMSGKISEMLNAGRYYLSSGNISQAGPLLEYAVRSDPQSATAHFLLGYAYFGNGNLKNADEEAMKAIRLHPEFWDAYLLRANVAIQNQKSDDAINEVEKVITKNPDYAQSYATLVRVYEVFHLDSIKLKSYRQRYQELTNQ